MLLLRIISLIVVYTIALVKHFIGDRLNLHASAKRALLILMTLAMVCGVITTIIDERKSSEASELQSDRQMALQLQNDSLRTRLDSLIKIGKQGDLNANRRDITLQGRIAELDSKLEPFIKMAIKNHPELKIADALSELLSDMREQKEKVSAILEYSEIASLNLIGLTGRVGGGLIESSRLSKILEGSYERRGDSVFFNCNGEAISRFQQAISMEPKFPFSYYALTSCLQRAGDPAWRTYAQKAISILKMTTLIDGHHLNHDSALKELERAVVGKQ